MESSDSSDTDIDLQDLGEESRDFDAESQMITNNLLPEKSCARYNLAYEDFIKWRVNNKTKSLDESVFLVYFDELSKKYKPSTLWSIWSMLRSTMMLRQNVNINDYAKLKSFLKNKTKGYKPKKAAVLTMPQIRQFINNSDDHIYLSTKVIYYFFFHYWFL